MVLSESANVLFESLAVGGFVFARGDSCVALSPGVEGEVSYLLIRLLQLLLKHGILIYGLEHHGLRLGFVGIGQTLGLQVFAPAHSEVVDLLGDVAVLFEAVGRLDLIELFADSFYAFK